MSRYMAIDSVERMQTRIPPTLARCIPPFGLASPCADRLKVLVLVLFAMALAFSGGARAMALTHSVGIEGQVICADGGETVIYLDTEGQPVDPMVHCSKCPECMNNLLHVVPTCMGAHDRPTFSAARLLPPAAPALAPSHHLRPQSRGPPVATPEKHDTAGSVVKMSLGVTFFARPGDRTERAFPKARS